MHTRAWRFLALLCLLWLASGCSGLALPGRAARLPDHLAPYRAAMAPDQQHLLDALGPLPEYRISLQVDPADLTLTGDMQVTVPADPSGEAPTEYYFRLYPNLPHYAASMGVDLVTVNGRGAPFSYDASNTALHVAAPPSAVQPGQPAVIGLQWTVQARSWPADRYSLFGQSEGVLSLPLFYPMLAVENQQQPGQWHLEMGLAQGDAALSQAALYQVTVTVPSNLVVVSTGSVAGVDDQQTSQQSAGEPDAAQSARTWRLISGPAREFALFLSDQYRLAETIANGVRVNSWYLPGDEDTGRAAADYAAAALRIYSQLFGPYPYAELDVVAGPLTYRGMEYPGLFELGIDLYRDHADELEFRIAHEVAHQWWYNLVGNDPVNTPWLDEGLAEYSTYFYRQQTKGQDSADQLAQARWQAAYEYLRAKGLDAVVNQPVDAFQGNYETVVYGKAALFFHVLQETMGEEQFLNLLRRYQEKYRFRIATPDDFVALASEVAGPAVADLYQRWILEAASPAPAVEATEDALD